MTLLSEVLLKTSGIKRYSLPDIPGIPVILMDGGTGTTLEDDFGLTLTSSALWSASLLRDSPGILADAHNAFMLAGSQVLSTTTYQAAFETFARTGIEESDATILMRRAVRLTAGAAAARHVVACLALGPYGATLSPAHEFDGLYPPPFGPADPTTTMFSPAQSIEEITAHEALVDFHLQRLLVFCEDTATWDRVDLILFETVPLLREAMAIRTTMEKLGNRLKEKGSCMKPWCISFVFPKGLSPEGPSVNAHVLIRSMLIDGPEESRASGIGINCTEPRYLPDLVRSYNQALSALWITKERSHARPWLIIYPNGGEQYNVISQTWSSSNPGDGQGSSPAERWALEVVQGISRGFGMEDNSKDRVWAGMLLGGCCKASPSYIVSLRELLL